MIGLLSSSKKLDVSLTQSTESRRKVRGLADAETLILTCAKEGTVDLPKLAAGIRRAISQASRRQTHAEMELLRRATQIGLALILFR